MSFGHGAHLKWWKRTITSQVSMRRKPRRHSQSCDERCCELLQDPSIHSIKSNRIGMRPACRYHAIVWSHLSSGPTTARCCSKGSGDGAAHWQSPSLRCHACRPLIATSRGSVTPLHHLEPGSSTPSSLWSCRGVARQIAPNCLLVSSSSREPLSVPDRAAKKKKKKFHGDLDVGPGRVPQLEMIEHFIWPSPGCSGSIKRQGAFASMGRGPVPAVTSSGSTILYRRLRLVLYGALAGQLGSCPADCAWAKILGMRP